MIELYKVEINIKIYSDSHALAYTTLILIHANHKPIKTQLLSYQK